MVPDSEEPSERGSPVLLGFREIRATILVWVGFLPLEPPLKPFFCFSYFSDNASHFFLRTSLGQQSGYLCFSVAGIIGSHHHAWLVC
jgi:hypothetical protein